MSTKWPQGDITPNLPASVLGGSNISGVYTLDQLNRLNADFGPQMQRSLRFRSSASAYLNRTPSVAGNRQTWTWSAWIKLGVLGVNRTLFATPLSTAGGLTGTYVQIETNNTIWLSSSTNGTYQFLLNTTQVFRDPSAWYHIVAVADTNNATSTDRARIYINGSRVTALNSAAYPSSGALTYVNSTVEHNINRVLVDGTPQQYFDGYMAEVNFIDGQALTPSSFGATNATTGVWQPIFYTGAYGTNGFRLTFADNSALTTSSNVGLGKDFSPNGNYWTTNNISLTAGSTYDSMLDVPTNWTSGNPVQSRGNYAVLNAVASDGTTSNANLTVAWASGNSAKPSTIGMTSGKWYCEIYMDSVGTAALPGIIPSTMTPSAGYPGSGSGGYGYYYDGQKYNAGAGSAYGASYTTGNIISIAFDADAGSLTFYKNGVSQGVAFSSIPAGTWFFAAGHSGACTMSPNFGQRPFSYTPPTGFMPLNTQNLPSPTIFNGAGYMAAMTYTGTGSSQTIANSAAFQPDLVWIKSRSAATDNKLTDSVRGATLALVSNSTAAETTDTTGLTAFNSSGFTLGTSTTYNNNAATYIAWQWKANGTAVSNTSGTITSQVSANPTAGFSVVTYTGTGANATVGHGLGVAPSLIILKYRNISSNWSVYHASVGNTGRLALNLTDAVNTSSTFWNNTSPTSTVFSLGSNFADTNTYVAYCFAAIAGYSAFGSYTGNGSADGPFVYLGFRPRFVLIKRSDVAENWVIVDTARNPYNAVTDWLFANTSDSTYTFSSPDILSNGFKLRNVGTGSNNSGSTYIYAAFAENPFKNSLAR